MRIVLVVVIVADLLLAGARALRRPAVTPPPAGLAAATPDDRGAVVAPPPILPAGGRPAPRARRAPRPVRITIPAIGVDAPLVPLGLDATGALAPPQGFTEAGWWAGGARPGERGPAVIAGHVDNKTGPAVFFRVPRLRRADVIVIARRDGSRVRFTVQRVAHYSKTRFPSRAVYGPTRAATLRLITCSGSFDFATGHYLDNTVVFAARPSRRSG